MGDKLCVGQKEPTEHVEQPAALSRSLALEKVPMTQGSGADAPTGQKLPASHALQTVEPATYWYVPAAHGSHLPAPGWSL